MNNKKLYITSKLLENIKLDIKKLLINKNTNFDEIYNFLKWTSEKLDFHFNSKVIPINFLPQTIDDFKYKALPDEIKTIINNYYIPVKNSFKFSLSKSKNISEEEKMSIVHHLILKRGNVVWVDYGFNIGMEFRGRHPALILKNTGNNLIVVPISSKTHTVYKDYCIEVDIIYKFPKIKRSIDLRRISNISLSRVNYTNYGHVAGTLMDEVNDGLKLLLKL